MHSLFRSYARTLIVATAVFWGGLVALVLLPAAYEQALSLTGIRRVPIREDHLRDCPRLPSGLYYDFRMSRDRQRPMLVRVLLSPPDARLSDGFGMAMLSRQGARVSARVPLEKLCDLANVESVIEITPDSPGHPG